MRSPSGDYATIADADSGGFGEPLGLRGLALLAAFPWRRLHCCEPTIMVAGGGGPSRGYRVSAAL